MRKVYWMTKACGIFLLWAAAAVALHAQTFTTLHSFDYADGANPEAGMVQGANGKFYGTTYIGGANSNGSVFSITTAGTLMTLHSFNGTDGANPAAGLILGIDGNFYGTTVNGGTNGDGTVFSITASGTLTTLHNFCSQGGNGCTDGSKSYSGLVQGANGKFYGTTYGGGANGDGTAFSITAGGTLTTLHSFDGTDGSSPEAGLGQATNGKFYGTTYGGGTNGYGTVFSITTAGTLTTLHSFDHTDGSNPEAGLVQATNGKFYGTTYSGGANGDGTVFSITTAGTLATLYSFCAQTDCTDGADPEAELVQGTNGKFYGTTAFGGTSDYGAVFGISVGLGPFVETNPSSGNVGMAVTILGTNLAGASSVTFNGTAATFTVVSGSEITTTVPTGATTGTVQVVTLSGTLSSNVPFTVN
jgi:uncharacterized repeat protein (TIGR03803 family)